jgi:hypothetical protein
MLLKRTYFSTLVHVGWLYSLIVLEADIKPYPTGNTNPLHRLIRLGHISLLGLLSASPTHV